jgi:hypothetical protein
MYNMPILGDHDDLDISLVHIKLARLWDGSVLAEGSLHDGHRTASRVGSEGWPLNRTVACVWLRF